MTARRGLWRWLVALVATMALVVSGSGLVVFAQSGAGESKGPQFVPADTAVYIEARLDMPAGQDEAVAQMMTAFPGFADAGSFDMKMNELIAGLVSNMGVAAPEGDLIGDVLTGEIGIAVGDLEAAMMSGSDPAVLIGAAIADAQAGKPVRRRQRRDVQRRGHPHRRFEHTAHQHRHPWRLVAGRHGR
jgi:hypothetical protein